MTTGAKTPQTLKGLAYARMPRAGAEQVLTTALYLPEAGAKPAPLLVWLGSAVYSAERQSYAGYAKIARRLRPEGIALAVPSCRVGAKADDLADTTRAGLAKLPTPDAAAPEQLTSAAAMAAIEDLCAFFTWVGEIASDYNLSGDVVLAGTGAGAGVALQTCVLAPLLGLECPMPKGVISYSGGCAWPGLASPDMPPVLALHNPMDQSMPVAPMRQMADAGGGDFTLIESLEQPHGSIGIWPGEALHSASRRIAGAVKRWTGEDGSP